MLCDFEQIGNTWICTRCGRTAPFNYQQKHAPTAACRVPSVFTSQFLDNVQIMGVGDALARIIKNMGFNYEPVSQARSKITYLNKKGIDWCREHQDVIVDWIMEEAPQNMYGRRPLKSLVRLAIRRANRAMAN